jgi:hypothetical protein
MTRNQILRQWWSWWNRQYREVALNASGAVDRGAKSLVDIAEHFDRWAAHDWDDLPETARTALIEWAASGNLL